MKTYKTCEVLKAIGENYKFKFQTIFSDGTIWEAFSRREGSGVRCLYGKGKPIQSEDFLTSDSNTMSRIWTLVQEPVDFMTAAKAKYEHKTIRCSLSDQNYDQYIYKNNGFIDHRGDCITAEQILYGKWYIEE